MEPVDPDWVIEARRNSDWIEAHLDELLQLYDGQLIAVANQQLIEWIDAHREELLSLYNGQWLAVAEQQLSRMTRIGKLWCARRAGVASLSRSVISLFGSHSVRLMADIIEFSGEAYRDFRGTLLPSVYYFLRFGERFTPPELGIVDSGADYVTVPQRLGRDLGLDLAQLPRRQFFTLAGQTHALPRAKVTLVCHGVSAEVEVVFSQVQFAFLGRTGLFEHFVFGIDEARQRVLIHRHSR
ncbi:MAG: hypothetical protein U0841_06600 [Chloroflexia bacterium]